MPLLLSLIACGPRQPLPGDGTVAEGRYANPFFGMTIRIPEGWTAVKGPDRMSRFLHYLLMMMAVQEGRVDAEMRVVPLVRLSSGTGASSDPDGAVVTVAAANLGSKLVTIKRGMDLARMMVKESPIPGKYRREPDNGLVGNHAAGTFELEWTVEGRPLFEAFSLLDRRRHMLVFHVSAATPEGLAAGKKVLESASWQVPER
ncbi:MAG: hypothetical protein HY924_04485 [Elusimicrobia bacterium]|nr:hypothetical protein [Elusimicrobiota bacterium]